MNAMMTLPETMTSVAAASLATFNVRLSNRAALETYLTGLAKRFAKKGLDGFAWSWGKAFEETVPCSNAGHGWSSESHTCNERKVLRVTLTLETKRPHYAGWNFVATLQHLPADEGGKIENIVRTVPGCMVHDDCKAVGREMGLACTGVADLPNEYRSRGPVCDHCKVNRRRNDTYVLHHISGKYAQVGSTCIADFLGSKEAEHMAFRAEMYALANAAAKAAEVEAPTVSASGIYEATSSWGTLLSTFLGYVAWVMRTQGWVSGKMVAEGRGHMSTASVAYGMTYGNMYYPGYETTSEDVELAVAAADWAENLTDAQVNAEPGEYLANLRTIARAGLMMGRNSGLAGSMIRAYQRANDLLPKPAQKEPVKKCDTWVGSVGVRLAFGTTKKLGKKIQKLSDETVVLVMARSFETFDGDVFSILKFQTADGVSLVWKTSGAIHQDDEGKRFMLIGTVKKHDEYKGERQTVLSRCDLTEVV